jgi:hypothetical protein
VICTLRNDVPAVRHQADTELLALPADGVLSFLKMYIMHRSKALRAVGWAVVLCPSQNCKHLYVVTGMINHLSVYNLSYTK